jgi:hypothetical protein
MDTSPIGILQALNAAGKLKDGFFRSFNVSELPQEVKDAAEAIFSGRSSHENENASEEILYPRFGETVQIYPSRPHTVLAVQYSENSVSEVMHFMHANHVMFGSCDHGSLLFLERDEEEVMKYGQWVVIRTIQGEKVPSLYDNDEFILEYGDPVTSPDACAEEPEESEPEPVSKTAYYRDRCDDNGIDHAYNEGAEV